MSDLANAKGKVARARVGRELGAYFALTFAITYGLGAAFIFFRPEFEALFGRISSPITSWPYYLAVSSPTISAIVVSLWFQGLNGAKGLFAGAVRPFRPQWGLLALTLIPTGLLVWGVAERFGSSSGASHAISLQAIFFAPLLWVTTPAIFVDPGPWGEETGWRGFALPRLLELMSPLAAALVLGAIWVVWHAPAFFVSGLSQFGLNFVWFFAGGVCLSILMAWIYVNANHNYLVAGFIPHAVSNLMFSAHVYRAVEIEALLYAVIAFAIVAAFGPTLKGWRASSRRVASA